MYFFKKQGKQMLDLRGDLILTHNPNLVTGRVKSAAPAGIRNAKYITDIHRMGFFRKLRVVARVIQFVWSDNQALTKATIEK